MSRYTADSRDRVLDAVDMVSLVSARTDLRRAGVDSYFGLCPFHDERTASFHVRPQEKHYYCFGCQAAGDPFTFVMETEGLDFKAALESLADRFGVALETEAEDPAAASRRQRRERLYTLLGRAASYYARFLWDSDQAAPAREYLLGRGLSEEILREFRVGYAPSAWDRMLRASKSAGFSDEELLAAGLAQRSKSRPGQVYDRFRERIMFPSADARGRVLGFGARAMRDNQMPKYLNTSDGELYHKRSQLFGIDRARAVAAKADRMILVEGYTDVLALHQAGLRNAVGIMGTSFTEEQLRELARVVSVLELCLDSDQAGQAAMVRAAKVASERRPPLELRVVALPPGTDPAEMVEREGADALRERVARSQPFVVFHVERILDRADLRSAEGRDAAFGELQPVLAELPASSLRDELMRKVSGRLELPESRLAALVAGRAGSAASGAVDRIADGRAGASRTSPPPLSRAVKSERAFLALCVALPDAGDEVLAEIEPDEVLTSEIYRRAARHLAGRCRTPMADLPDEDEELARTVAELVDLAGRREDITVDRLHHARLLLELARLDRAIVRTRAQGGEGVSELARERQHALEALHGVVTRLERAV